ncbi:MAG: DUF488 family protein [Proteobacteria bacterium]|nr:DUF488 family protein [Pseudomonadota bacterium]
MLFLKRIYEPADDGDGARFLVDRLWPRGISKERANLTAWFKALSPSDEMRKTFHGATAGSDAAWAAFRKAYDAELDQGSPEIEAELAALRDALSKGTVTLLFGAHDTARNNAVALHEWLIRRGIVSQ